MWENDKKVPQDIFILDVVIGCIPLILSASGWWLVGFEAGILYILVRCIGKLCI